MLDQLRNFVPVLVWGRTYNRSALFNDIVAAVVVTMMLIPQSLAYALLAGLPPEAGLYASIVPVVLYAIFGSSRTLAVGPVAIVSLITAYALGQVAEQGTADYLTAALTLAFLSGGFLLVLGVFRLGFLANFLSRPVIAGFITASGILIAVGQLKHILGVKAEGYSLFEMLRSLLSQVGQTSIVTLAIGSAATIFLLWIRSKLKPVLCKRGFSPTLADLAAKISPVAAVVVTTFVSWFFALNERGVSIVGEVPQRLPPLTLPSFSPDLIAALAVPAVLISIVGFVESVSVAETLAAKKHDRIDPDQELIGLGAANLGAAFTGGYPVAGGFARSVVNYEAGAETPAAGAFTALGLAIAAVALTPLVYFLPQATLAALIIVAVLSLVDASILGKTWAYSKADFAAVAVTILLTLGLGVEIGVASGIVISVLLHLYKTSRPHVAEVGLVPSTQHFRNIRRHKVATDPSLLTLRIDESLYFVNARFLEDQVQARVMAGEGVRDVVLMFSAVNDVDFSAMESLVTVNRRLTELGVRLHLSEVKGPVMDRLKSSNFLNELNGEVFLSQYEAWKALSGEMPECNEPASTCEVENAAASKNSAEPASKGQVHKRQAHKRQARVLSIE